MKYIKKFYELYNFESITNEAPLESLLLIPKSKLNDDDPIIKAEKIFGITDDFRECGYITIYGDMLDFSEKRIGGPPHTRNADHRQINDADISMIEFMEMGNIRFKSECNGFEVTRPLTKYQKNALFKFIEQYGDDEIYVDLNFGKVDKYSTYVIYPPKTKYTKIFNDIDKYYTYGIKPLIKK